MAKQYRLIQSVNIVVCALYGVHICFEYITSGLLGYFFNNALFLPVILLLTGLQCYYSESTTESHRRYQLFGSLILFITATISVISGILRIGCHHGDDCFPCHYSIQHAIGYLIPFLTAAGIYQYLQKWKLAANNFQKARTIFSLAVLIIFSGYVLISMIRGAIDQPELISIKSLSVSDFYYIPFVPVFLGGNALIFFTQSVKETITSVHSNKI